MADLSAGIVEDDTLMKGQGLDTPLFLKYFHIEMTILLGVRLVPRFPFLQEWKPRDSKVLQAQTPGILQVARGGSDENSGFLLD